MAHVAQRFGCDKTVNASFNSHVSPLTAYQKIMHDMALPVEEEGIDQRGEKHGKRIAHHQPMKNGWPLRYIATPPNFRMSDLYAHAIKTGSARRRAMYMPCSARQPRAGATR